MSEIYIFSDFLCKNIVLSTIFTDGLVPNVSNDPGTFSNLVYPMILGHFQITRLMLGKYGGHSADDILKLILFIKNVVKRFQMEIVPLTVSRQLYSRYQITYRGNKVVLGVLAIIINTHS